MLIQLNVFLSLAISFSIAFFIIPKIIKVSRIKNLFDVPNHRSAAKHVVPTLGGIAIYAGFRMGQVISLNSYNTNELKYLSAGILIMFLIGMKDDLVGIAAKTKLLIQVLTASYLVILGHFRITNLHGIMGIDEIGYFAGVILSIIIIVGIINSLNLIDGIDGLASGVGILISVVLGLLFLNGGDLIYALSCFSLTGSLIAFFLYNVFGTKNKIFMGDTGSLVLGIIVAILIIHFNEFIPVSNHVIYGSPAIALVIIIVPVVDTLRVFAIRIRQKKSPFSPDMSHIHHQLLRVTGNHLYTSLIIISVNMILILISFSLVDILESSTLFFLLLITGFLLANVPSWILKFLKRDQEVVKESKSILAYTIFLKKEKE